MKYAEIVPLHHTKAVFSVSENGILEETVEGIEFNCLYKNVPIWQATGKPLVGIVKFKKTYMCFSSCHNWKA